VLGNTSTLPGANYGVTMNRSASLGPPAMATQFFRLPRLKLSYSRRDHQLAKLVRVTGARETLGRNLAASAIPTGKSLPGVAAALPPPITGDPRPRLSLSRKSGDSMRERRAFRYLDTKAPINQLGESI
jgi:hypothetical protein